MNNIVELNAKKVIELAKNVEQPGTKNEIFILFAEAYERGYEEGVKQGQKKALEAINSLLKPNEQQEPGQ